MDLAIFLFSNLRVTGLIKLISLNFVVIDLLSDMK